MICCAHFSNVGFVCGTALENTLSFQLNPLGKWLSRWALEIQRKNMSLSWGLSLVQGMKESTTVWLELRGWPWVRGATELQGASSCFVSQL